MDATSGPRVLVTGASGFVGGHVVAQLRAAGAQVETVSARDRAHMAQRVGAFAPEVAIHLGGFTDIGSSWANPQACFEANVAATIALLDALGAAECRRVVFASTADVYGDLPAPFREDAAVRPLSPYAVSKWSAERLCELAYRTGGPAAVVLRLFNTYGPNQPVTRLVPDVIRSALAGRNIELTRGLQRREANFVGDIAGGIVAAATADGIDGEVVNLGSGEAISVRDLTSTILDLMGNPVQALFGAKPERPVEVEVVEADIAKAQRLLGWAPRTALTDGLRATIDWYAATPLSVVTP
jgi:nucleoside-diphosphate-sugar epimerase